MSGPTQFLLIIFCLLISFNINVAYKILIVPVYQKSHLSSLMTIADELDNRGHDVHILGFDGFSGISLNSSVNGTKVKVFQMRFSENAGKSYDMNELMHQLSLEFLKFQGNNKKMFHAV